MLSLKMSQSIVVIHDYCVKDRGSIDDICIYTHISLRKEKWDVFSKRTYLRDC
jgi:hypothetical protein